MQKAYQIQQALRKLGEKRLPLTRVYRSLYNEDLFLSAYHKLYRNAGALTPGTTTETVDGMSLKRIHHIIDQLRQERYRFQPVRRIYLPKPKGGKRPLGLPTFSDKLVQEVLHQLLEAYYEPRFRNASHGFRPGRGCHTALTQLKQQFRGTVWLIEGDIRGCFDNIDHDILLKILARDIHDGRLLNLIRLALQAGVMEDWQYHRTYSGTPQGGVLSPLLANIYLHELDTFVEDVLIPQYTHGKRKADNPAYAALDYRIRVAQVKQDWEQVQQLKQQRGKLPSLLVNDPQYRRLYYVRYADDFLIGFVGTKAEALTIKRQLGEFIKDTLHLHLSEDKTLITHGRSEYAHFLGYAVSIYHNDRKRSYDRRVQGMKRSLNGQVRLGVPYGLVDQHCQVYQKKGKPVQYSPMVYLSDADIILRYQQRYRGLVEYYQYATDRGQFNKLRYVMEVSLTKTLAQKLKMSVAKVYQKYHGTRQINGHTYRTLQVDIPAAKGTQTIWWGAVPLTVVKPNAQAIMDHKYVEWQMHSDLVQRLQANTCELCGGQGECEVHHIRKLSDLKNRWAGRKEKPEWIKRMIAMHRKTLVVCRTCHLAIHSGRALPNDRTGVLESRVR
ncbi:MAG: reverse transcriptase domain-containing protein [Anaerolineae bacterium]